ncbi:DUF4282 domain-containing protein [Vibrio sp.]|uniref:DUF4282 domain-containing protein n=1 Tax=Vibrio sp. TaxID=678 RepID=UPI003D14802D
MKFVNLELKIHNDLCLAYSLNDKMNLWMLSFKDPRIEEAKEIMKRFFSFERMITPIIIKILFWIGIVGSFVAGVIALITISAMSDGRFPAVLLTLLFGLLGGILTFAIGALITRIYCELMILAFRINETLTDIKVLLEKDQPVE